MKQRCNDIKNKRYKNYGGRGIKVCKRWSNSFDLFLQDMGKKPSLKHQIDRIDNNKGYSPDNCHWVLAKENQSNRTNTTSLLVNGIKMTHQQISEQFGINRSTVSRRVAMGYTVEEIIKPGRASYHSIAIDPDSLLQGNSNKDKL